MLWGSVGKIARTIGYLYGKKVGKHKELILWIKDLAELKNRPEVNDWISAAEALHSNFYHNWMEERIFIENVKKVIKLRDWLFDILDEKKNEIAQQLS